MWWARTHLLYDCVVLRRQSFIAKEKEVSHLVNSVPDEIFSCSPPNVTYAYYYYHSHMYQYALKVKPPKTATVESMLHGAHGVFGSDCGSS